ncbi:hypothetical protein Ae201684P_014480 [Aphanomyces euteiches]|nr:hypothetical protein Ae201684P_014480 [Aphanomyces euteiches]
MSSPAADTAPLPPPMPPAFSAEWQGPTSSPSTDVEDRQLHANEISVESNASESDKRHEDGSTTPKTPPCPNKPLHRPSERSCAAPSYRRSLRSRWCSATRNTTPKEQEQAKKKSYADLLKGDQDNAPPKRVKTVVNRPKPEYLSKLIDLASQEDANEEDVLEAISQATPIQVKKATTTMWIETNGALYDKVYTNEKNHRRNLQGKSKCRLVVSPIGVRSAQQNAHRRHRRVRYLASREGHARWENHFDLRKEFTIPVPKVRSLGSSPSQELNDRWTSSSSWTSWDSIQLRLGQALPFATTFEDEANLQAYRQHYPMSPASPMCGVSTSWRQKSPNNSLSMVIQQTV